MRENSRIKGLNVFIDAKLLDIEATVERATATIAKGGAKFLTVHATDRKTLDAAVRGRGNGPLKLLGVTVLTNLTTADLAEQGSSTCRRWHLCNGAPISPVTQASMEWWPLAARRQRYASGSGASS